MQSFQNWHLQEQGGVSHSIATRICLLFWKDIYPRRKHWKPLSKTRFWIFQAGKLNCEKVFSEVQLSATKAELLEEWIEHLQLLWKQTQHDCFPNSFPMDISIQFLLRSCRKICTGKNMLFVLYAQRINTNSFKTNSYSNSSIYGTQTVHLMKCSRGKSYLYGSNSERLNLPELSRKDLRISFDDVRTDIPFTL